MLLGGNHPPARPAPSCTSISPVALSWHAPYLELTNGWLSNRIVHQARSPFCWVSVLRFQCQHSAWRSLSVFVWKM